MAGATTALVVGSALAGAYGAKKSADAAKAGVNHQRRESDRAYAHQQERLRMQREAPGSQFAYQGGFDSIMNVFANSMAGKAGGFDPSGALIAMGARNPDGSKGPLYGGFQQWYDWRRSQREANRPTFEQMARMKFGGGAVNDGADAARTAYGA